MDVLLIYLYFKTDMDSFLRDEFKYNPSLGLLSIASFLNMYGYNVKVIDFNYEEFSYNKIYDLINNEKPLLIGITAYSETCDDVLKLSDFIKATFPSVNILVGGPHASLKPNYFKKSKSIDYIVIGEGESSILELLESLNSETGLIELSDIDGLVINNDNQKDIKPKSSKKIKLLDLLPIINREIMDIKKYGHTVNLYTSRGCPSNCIYCSATALSGAEYRTREVINTFIEMVFIIKQLDNNIPCFYFVDDTFTAIHSRVFEFISIINDSKLPIKWACESRIDVMNNEFLKRMYDSGCYSLQFGIESGNQKVLDKLGKNINLNHAKNIVLETALYDIEICLSFMLGHYCDTEETLRDTYNTIKELTEFNPNVKIAIAYNTPFPGTWQHTNAEKIGIKFLTKKLSKYDLMTPVIETEGYSKKQVEAVYKDIYKLINRREACRLNTY